MNVVLGMLAAAALVTLQAPSTEGEIVVVANKLRLTQGMVTTNVLTGKSRCTVEKTSGDARVDKAVCDIAIDCIRRKDDDAFKACVHDGRKQFLAELSKTLESSAQ